MHLLGGWIFFLAFREIYVDSRLWPPVPTPGHYPRISDLYWRRATLLLALSYAIHPTTQPSFLEPSLFHETSELLSIEALALSVFIAQGGPTSWPPMVIQPTDVSKQINFLINMEANYLVLTEHAGSLTSKIYTSTGVAPKQWLPPHPFTVASKTA